MIDKFVESAEAAVADVRDGDTILIGGFGSVGQPDVLIEALADQGARDLVVVANNAGSGQGGLAKLLALGRVRRIVCSFPRSGGSTVFEELFAAGRIELGLVPQGTLAERLRAAGAGIPAFFTPTGYGTRLAEGKETRVIDGKGVVLEQALHGDIALVEAWAADRWGNLMFRESARNFNPVMAMAARTTIAQVRHRRDLGALDPEAVMTPGIFIDRLVQIGTVPRSEAA